ncbi:hypothetical protein D9M72_477160 [compost metagenome]
MREPEASRPFGRPAPAYLLGAPRPDGTGDLVDPAVGLARRVPCPQRHDLRPDRPRQLALFAGTGERCREERRVRGTAFGGAAGEGRRCPGRDQGRWPFLLERLRWFCRRRSRVCRASSWRRSDAAALDQRHLQRAVRLPRFGGRRGLLLEPQFARLPVDAVDERHGHQPSGRGDLHPRHGEWFGIDALCVALASPLRRLRNGAWARLFELPQHPGRPRDRGDPYGSPEPAGKARPRLDPQPCDDSATVEALRLQRMGTRQQSRPLGALHSLEMG